MTVNPQALHAFAEKLAAAGLSPGLIQRLSRAAVSGPGSGAGVGAGVGAALGGARGFINSEEGEGLSGALRGAVQGGVLGGAGGAALGGMGRGVRDAKLLYSDKSTLGAVGTHLGSGLRRFGGRLRHGFTGHGDAAALGMSSTRESNRRIDLLRRRADADIAFNPAKADDIRKNLAGEIKGLQQTGAAGDTAIDAGVTNIPGLLKGLATDPRKTGRGLMAAMSGGGSKTMMLGMGVGLPVAAEAPELLRGDESATGGLSTTKKVLRLGTRIGGGVLTAGLPIVPAMAANMATDTLTDRALGVRPPTAQLA